MKYTVTRTLFCRKGRKPTKVFVNIYIYIYIRRSRFLGASHSSKLTIITPSNELISNAFCDREEAIESFECVQKQIRKEVSGGYPTKHVFKSHLYTQPSNRFFWKHTNMLLGKPPADSGTKVQFCNWSCAAVHSDETDPLLMYVIDFIALTITWIFRTTRHSSAVILHAQDIKNRQFFCHKFEEFFITSSPYCK